MKLIQSIFFSLFIVCGISAQNVEILGKVTDLEGKPLPGATIKYNEKSGTMADAEGNFYINIEAEGRLQLTIRYIGYETIDTTLLLSGSNKHFLSIEMTPQLFQLPDVEISATYQNIFEEYRYHIIDFTISEDIIYLIIKKGRKSFIVTTNLRGTVLDEHELNGGYSRFYNSCLGGIILVGKESCAELHDIDDQLFVTNEFSIDYFNKYIIPCKVSQDKALIFKLISRHNKKIDYIKFEESKEAVHLFSVYDRVGEKVSQSYFNDLLREYFKESGKSSLIDIDYGFERQNIIADGSWNGDIQDLIITNTTHRLALQYQALGLKEVSSELFLVDENIFVLDDLNKEVFKLNISDHSSEKFGGFAFEGDDVEFIQDQKRDTYILKDDVLFSTKIADAQLDFDRFKELETVYFNERNLIYKGILYRLGRKSINNVRKNIFREPLNPLN